MSNKGVLGEEAIDPACALTKQSDLILNLRELESVMVAYSGGVDSSLLAYYARRELGKNALIVIAVSESLAKVELEAAREQASIFNWQVLEIETEEVSKPEYQKNDHMRCYFCKATLFEAMHHLASRFGVAHLAYGANVDDLSDFRPGHIAARRYSVISPLQEAGLSKLEIRFLARQAGLPSWDRPQQACLSSRFPVFEPITIENLSLVEKAEEFVRSLGFRQVRVRHYSYGCRVEVDKHELVRFSREPTLSDRLTCGLNKLGYGQVVIEKDGYVQGSATDGQTKTETAH